MKPVAGLRGKEDRCVFPNGVFISVDGNRTGDILEEKGLIRDAKLFYFQEMFSEYKGELKPGVYELSTGMTPYEMMEIMSASDEEEE